MFKNFVNKLFGDHAFTNQLAKNRLQMVLIQDRSGLSSQEMDKFRNDLMKVIAIYFETNQANLDIQWERKDGSTALIINTPVMVRRKQIQAVAANQK
ncbi:MAG: cell division topological specificity factor MinE [Deltaproteobacteria bacterium]|nr:cell division topological specificity factor MinE [Deltaproteobacteria bacterium]